MKTFLVSINLCNSKPIEKLLVPQKVNVKRGKNIETIRKIKPTIDYLSSIIENSVNSNYS